MFLRSLAAAAAVLMLAAALLAGPSAFAAINSNLTIDPGKTFVLGGGQSGAFTVSGENTGNVAVIVLARDDEGDTELATIAPGESFKQPFARSEGALLRNTSANTRARVKLRVTGDTGDLAMRYIPEK